MPKKLLDALNNFDAACKFERYNMFNCHQVGSMTLVEAELASALTKGELSEDETTEIRERVNSVSDLGAKLVAFSIRMATAALQNDSVDLVKAGVVALTLDDNVLDDRDIYVALAVLNDAGTRLSVATDEVFLEATMHATPRRQAAIGKGFVEGPKYMRSLSSMGVELQDDNIYSVNMF